MWRRNNYVKFLRSMAAWGGNQNLLTNQEILIMNTKLSLWPISLIILIVLGLLIATGSTYAKQRSTEAELNAYKRISEEFGVIKINPEDGKKYVSFAFRAQRYPSTHQGETPEFLNALESLQYIPNLRGVHIDGLLVTQESLNRLTCLSTLERVTARDSYPDITGEAVYQWNLRRKQCGKPPVDVWLIYDAEHP